MNIKITYNWLLEYLETDAGPYEIQKYLSLCGPSIEKVIEYDSKGIKDYIFDIEVTSNRIDTASVFGIAQEAQAILPQFNKKAQLKFNPLEKYRFGSLEKELGVKNKLDIQITDSSLCSRFTALILDVKIEKSPEIIKQRLTMCDIKSISNVIDISNYLMLALGQPTHIFDYDKIKNKKMWLRLSKPGEKIITLDGKEINLPGNDIVIEDGSGKLIDLCGIMGGLNSSVTPETKKIILFVQTYNKRKIRQTSMTTGQRTMAATYFEKGLDEDRVEAAIIYGVELLKKSAGGIITSPLYDIYPQPYQSKKITVNQDYIDGKIGVKVPKDKSLTILKSLGFNVNLTDNQFEVEIPSYRKNDVSIKEDIVEEIARVNGYFNLPGILSPYVYIKQPEELQKFFFWSNRVKYFLKDLGLNEVVNYSMVSEKLLNALELKPETHLCLSNTISDEIKYLRTSLLVSLIKNIKDNQGKKKGLKFFELAKVYHKKDNDLPEEKYKLGLVTNSNFQELKGIVEALFTELKIKKITRKKTNHQLFSDMQVGFMVNNNLIAIIGELKPPYKLAMEIKDNVILAELDFQKLASLARVVPDYKPINPYAVINLDATFGTNELITYQSIIDAAYKTSSLLIDAEVISGIKETSINNKLTLRFYFSSPERNITIDDAKQELEKIKLMVPQSGLEKVKE